MNSHLEDHLPGAEECNLNLRLHLITGVFPTQDSQDSFVFAPTEPPPPTPVPHLPLQHFRTASTFARDRCAEQW